jgi:hypothetical protein
MPLLYAIDKDRQLIITTASDRVTYEEIKDHQGRLLRDSNFDPRFNQIIDMTAVTTLDISIEEAKRIAQRPLFSKTSRRAFVASDPGVFGMGRLMEAYNEMSDAASRTYVFSDLPSALIWLG